MLVKVDDLAFSDDFVILEMPGNAEIQLILGRPFLVIGRPLIDMKMSELALRFDKEQVVFNMFEATKHQYEQPQCYKVSKRRKLPKRQKLARTKLRVILRVFW